MDLLKIPLWLFLVISTVSCMSKCKTNFKSNYLVPNNVDDSNKNCFCFKKPGNHRSVADILNKKKYDLKRLVVYLYKDKNTDQVKLYIPNAEKQSLVPDLALEVGDKLNSLEDDSKVKDIFNLYARSTSLHANPEHVNENELTTETTLPDTMQYVISHEVTHSTKGNENHIGDVNNDESSVIHLKPLNEVIPGKSINVEDFDNNENYYLPEYNVDFNKTPIKEIEIPNEVININSNNNNDPSGIDLLPSEVGNIPAESLYGNGFDDHEQHHLPENNVDINKISSNEVDIPDKDDNFDYSNYNEPNGINLIPSEVVNIPAEGTDVSGFNDNEHHLPENNVDKNKTTLKNVDVPEKVIYIDGDNYNEQNGVNLIPSVVGNIAAESLYVNGFDEHEKHHLPETNVNINKTPSIELDILDEGIYIDDDNYNDHHLPENNVDINKTPLKKVNITDETSIFNKLPSKKVNIPGKGTINYFDKKGDGLPYYYTTDNVPKQSDTKSNEKKWNAYIQSNEEVYFIDKTQKSAEKHNTKEKQATIPFENHSEYQTFDRWFIQQMQRFRSYTEHDRAINLVIIERYILKILQDNDMHVTNEGVLTDSFGTALDVQNLHLRPILIGNSLAFGSILNEKVTDLVMPANMAYLQAILVTNSNPSMILGIIPIGKTVIPPSTINAFSTFLKPHYNLLRDPKHHRTHLPTKVRYNKPSAGVNNMGFIYGNKPIVVHLSRKVPVVGPKKSQTIITIVKKTPVKKPQDHLSHQSVNSQVNDGRYSEGKESALSNESLEAVNKLIESLRDGNDPIKSAEATNTLLASLKNGKGSLDAKLTYEKSNPVDVDGEDISERIVGGNAATSSGAPLSVKGRIKD